MEDRLRIKIIILLLPMYQQQISNKKGRELHDEPSLRLVKNLSQLEVKHLRDLILHENAEQHYLKGG
jgi:hypothetical protein